MNGKQSLEISLEKSLVDDLDHLAKLWGRTREHVLQTAIMRLVDEETPIDDRWRDLPLPPPPPGLEVLDEADAAMRRFIQEGIDDVERGAVVSHEEVFRELRRRRRKNAA